MNDLQLGSDGAVWAATEGGLSRVKDGRVTTLTSRNGLPCDAVNWVMEDNDHSFWLYMACGLVRIARSELDAWVRDPKRSVQTTVFDSSDGVRSRALPGHYGRKVTKSPDGKIWFSPPDGVSIIDPRHLPFNKLPPPVHVRANHRGRQAVRCLTGIAPAAARPRSLDRLHGVELGCAGEESASASSWKGRTGTGERLSISARWSTRIFRRGNYRFRVTACNNSGVWNEAGTSLDFSIAPAYYQTNWFRALCVVAFLAMLWGLYQFRLRQMAHQFDMRLEARVSERTRIARDLHDTLLQSFHGLLAPLSNCFEPACRRATRNKNSTARSIRPLKRSPRDAMPCRVCAHPRSRPTTLPWP